MKCKHNNPDIYSMTADNKPWVIIKWCDKCGAYKDNHMSRWKLPKNLVRGNL